MTWWDHEELKSPNDRSDRYILAFPSEYSKDVVMAACKRRLEKLDTNKNQSNNNALKFWEI